MNSITTLKTDIQLVIDKARGASTPLALIFFLFIAIFGIYPDADLFWAHCRIAEWGALLFLTIFYLRNFWIRSFVLACFISLVYTSLTHPQKAGASAYIYFYYIFLFSFFFQFLDDRIKKEQSEFILNSLCVIAILQTAYIFLQHFRIDPIFQGFFGAQSYASMDVKDLVVGTFAHTNLSGAYLACSIPLFLRKRWFLFLPFMLIALFWTRSWGAILACAVGVIFWVIFSLPKKFKILSAIVILISAIFYGYSFEHKQFNPLRSDRMQYFKPTIQMIKSHPFIGWGLGQYKNAFYSVNKNIFGSNIQKTHAHFDLLELTLELGVLGAVPILGFIIALLFHFLNNPTVLSASAMAGAISLVINSCSSFIFHTPLAWIFLIYVIVITKETKNVDPLHGRETKKSVGA